MTEWLRGGKETFSGVISLDGVWERVRLEVDLARAPCMLRRPQADERLSVWKKSAESVLCRQAIEGVGHRKS